MAGRKKADEKIEAAVGKEADTKETDAMTDFEKADEKLHLAAIAKDPYEAAVGGYLQLYLAGHPDEAAKFLAEKKDVKGCMSHIKEAARKEVKGNVAVLSDAAVFKLAREYFGLAATDESAAAALPSEAVTAAPVPPKEEKAAEKPQGILDFDFEDFLD